MKDLSDVHGAIGPDALAAAVAGNTVQLSGLPPIDDGADLVANPPPLTPEVICGLLRRGWKGVIGGGSKSFKTWSLADMAISVASGEPWWGFETVPGRVLYIQLENQRAGFASRLRAICEARGITLPKDALRVWNLRGHTANRERLIANVIAEAKGSPYSLVTFDPLYKMTAGLDENAAGDMAKGLAQFDAVAEETRAAVVYGHHFSKGNQALKDSIDRMSGSGVFARDADSIITMTRHQEEGAFTVEPVLRECAPVEPFVVRWAYPLMQRDAGLNPAELKQAKPGRAATHTAEQVLEVLRQSGAMKSGELAARCNEEFGMSSATFYRLFAQLKTGRKVISSIADAGAWLAA